VLCAGPFQIIEYRQTHQTVSEIMETSTTLDIPPRSNLLYWSWSVFSRYIFEMSKLTDALNRV